MTWTCCDEDHLDDVFTCPVCGARKAAWTLKLKKTRLFTLPFVRWIELELCDSDGEPVPYEPYVLSLPDGTTLEGELDEWGEASLKGIRYSKELKDLPCQLVFPDIDDDDWEDATHDLRYDSVDGEQVETGWLTLELVDERGDPLAEEPYRLQLADGTERKGKLGKAGMVHLQDLPLGPCKLWFDEIDGSDWADATVRLNHMDVFSPAPVKDAWVSIELLDDCGDPVPQASYKVTFSDQEVREGKLDDQGFVLLERASPGRCTVQFKDIDAADWSSAGAVQLASADAGALERAKDA